MIRLERLLATTNKGGYQFLPCAGNRNGTSVNNIGNNGNCWSSSPNEDNENNAYYANFNYDDANVNNNNRYNGYSVRLVSVQNSSYLYSRQLTNSILLSFSLSYSQLRKDLQQAFHDAARRKRSRAYVAEFESDLDSNLDALAEELYTRTWKPLPSTYFATDNREVFAARFRDRIVHHLYFNYTHRLFDRTFINREAIWYDAIMENDNVAPLMSGISIPASVISIESKQLTYSHE